MNHWKETAEVLVRVAELAAAGKRAALATVGYMGEAPIGLICDSVNSSMTGRTCSAR